MFRVSIASNFGEHFVVIFLENFEKIMKLIYEKIFGKILSKIEQLLRKNETNFA